MGFGVIKRKCEKARNLRRWGLMLRFDVFVGGCEEGVWCDYKVKINNLRSLRQIVMVFVSKLGFG